MLSVNKALENYAPLPPDHFLANVGRELQRLNAHDSRAEQLAHAKAILRGAMAWVIDEEEAYHERDG